MQLRIKRGKSVRRDNVRLDTRTLCPLVTLLTNTPSLAMRVSAIRRSFTRSFASRDSDRRCQQLKYHEFAFGRVLFRGSRVETRARDT